MLEEGVNNFIASIYLEGESYGVAVADISTGEIHLTQFEDPQDETIKNEISRFAPSEIVFNTAFLSKNHIASFIKERLSCCAECLDDSAYAVEEAKARVLSHFGEETLQNLSLEEKPLAVCAAGGLLSYSTTPKNRGGTAFHYRFVQRNPVYGGWTLPPAAPGINRDKALQRKEGFSSLGESIKPKLPWQAAAAPVI